jgi:exodeoxyribonuclease VII small subunit
MSDKGDGDKKIAEMSFEEALKELEDVVETLEGRDGASVPLDQAITLYERGEKLREICEERLHDAEMRVNRIIQNSKGEAVGTEPLDKSSGPGGSRNDGIPF